MSDTVIRIPNAADFSPNQVNLLPALQIVRDAAGDKSVMIERLRQEFFSHRAGKRANREDRLVQQNKSANNILISLRCYDLLDSENRLTAVGQSLVAEGDDVRRAGAFARHILLNLHGIEVIYGVWALQKRAEQVTKRSLARQLTSMGLRTHQGGEIEGDRTLHTYMLMWLQQAKVIDPENGYAVDEAVFLEMCCVSRGLLEELRQLSRPQRDFLGLLRGKDPGQRTHAVKAIKEEMTEAFVEDQLAEDVTRPLADAGWITWDRTSVEGRGGKSGTVTVQDKLLEVPPAFLRFGETDPVPPKVRKLLDRRLEDIEKDIDSVDTKLSGHGLEALAVRMAYDISLTPTDVRSRKEGSKDAEVDVVAETQDVLFARWLFQCKKQNSVGRDILVREVGLASLMQAQVIVLVTWGKFKPTVQPFADAVTRSTASQVVLVNGDTVRRYLRRGGGPEYLKQFFQEVARRNMAIKRGQPISALPE
ncbi:Restriction endonuclease [Gemmata sp. SH-PL17]|uniref:restriction endonuclease n=1 Tax=Gemmata sp. SH-PL17 TaxID=1630693 RepID=UPI00078E5DD7|nr:restriction endonuclease [Gemmata sp. SH-PL17]AMV24220.1 Restriction endonuclease [Gemmata sp. SH-PL17]